MRIKIFLLILILLIPVSKVAAISITVSTDKSAYKRGETVKVTGSISGAGSYPVSFTWEAKDSEGHRIDFGQGTTDVSGKFSFSFIIRTTSSLGKATVVVSYAGTTGSASFYIKKSSSISISVYPQTVNIGGKVTISGSLTPSLQGASIKIFQLSGGTWTQIATVTTDSSGKYSYTWTAEKEGTYSFKASWNGNAEYFGSTSNTVSVKVAKPSKPKASLTISVNATRISLGESIRVAGKLKPEKNTKISLTYITPQGRSLEFKVEAKAGSFSHVFKPDKYGVWRVKAAWPGDEEYAGAESNILRIIVEKKKSNITLNIYPPEPEVFSVVTVNGSLYPPLENETLNVLIKNPEGLVSRGEIVTEKGGFYELTFEVNVSGVWSISISWNGSSLYDRCIANKTFTVYRKPSQLTLYFNPPIGVEGGEVEIRGSLTPPLEGEGILLKVSMDRGKTWLKIAEIKTGKKGEYKFIWSPKASVYLIMAEWPGSEAYSNASVVKKFEVVKTLKKTEINARGVKAEILFLANISIAEFKVEKGILAAKVNGASSGYLRICIDKAIYDAYNASPESSIVILSEGLKGEVKIEEEGEYYIAEIFIPDLSNSSEICFAIITWSLKIKVLDSKGNPLPNARVFLISTADFTLNYSAESNSGGEVVFTKVPSGEYKVEVFYWGVKVGEEEISVDEDSEIVVATKVGYWEAKYEELNAEYSKLEKDYEALTNKYRLLEEEYSKLTNISYQLAICIAALSFLVVFLILYTIFHEKNIFFNS